MPKHVEARAVYPNDLINVYNEIVSYQLTELSTRASLENNLSTVINIMYPRLRLSIVNGAHVH